MEKLNFWGNDFRGNRLCIFGETTLSDRQANSSIKRPAPSSPLTVPRMPVAVILRAHQHRHRRVHAQRHREHQPLGEPVQPDLAQHRRELRPLGARRRHHRHRRRRRRRRRCGRPPLQPALLLPLLGGRCGPHQRQPLRREVPEEARSRRHRVADDRHRQHRIADHKVDERGHRGGGAERQRHDLGERRKDAAQRLAADHRRHVLAGELAADAEQGATEDGRGHVHDHHRGQGEREELGLPAVGVHLHQGGGEHEEDEHQQHGAEHAQRQRNVMADEGVEDEEQGAGHGGGDAQVGGEAGLDGRQLAVRRRVGEVAEFVHPVLRGERVGRNKKES